MQFQLNMLDALKNEQHDEKLIDLFVVEGVGFTPKCGGFNPAQAKPSIITQALAYIMLVGKFKRK